MRRNRIKILKNVVLVALGIILVRLFFIQIIEHNSWVAKADKEHTLLETIPAKRGEIYMMDKGEPVAVVLNQTTYQIVIDPSVTKKEDIKKVLDEYAKDYISADLDEVYSTEGLRYSVVAKNVPREIASKIAESETPAIWLHKNNQRVYPEDDLASGMLGFVNADGLGQYGAEGSLNDVLAGKDGLLKTTADVNKVALSIGNDNIKIPAEDGKNVVLSVDRSLERGVEEIAMEHIESTPATNASALIMNPETGEVIAMANLPNYNPGNYGEVKDASAYINQVTEVPYEPASVCKSFAFSSAINEGVMSADTTYFNQGYEIIDNWKIKNAEQRSSLYGTINMKTALYWSLNTGSIYALKLLGGNPNEITQAGREKLYDYYYNKFRLGQPTGIELIEAEGFIPDPNEGWGRDSVYANMTFGQNLGITMIQTATAYSAVVNGGTYHTPTIVKGILENDEIVPLNESSTGDRAGGSPIESSDEMGETARSGPVEKINEKILSDETSATMRDMFINNRDYKKRAGIDREGYAVGGKSGTAQVIKDGAYDDTMSETVGTYIGFVGPEGELPKYVIMVKMWGEGQYLDGLIASDLFDDLSNYLIDYLKIKPGA
ncbi:penicillin-binding protein 2 [Candidatus Saccharibacteria bacterium]|nr:penicillin-binding protein 2 [Candidatus Saccharibacteria bacterium]MBR0372709.1 penicillin-binding protein 2 [Candidatus Saccharibacteria bacterium]